MVVFDLYNRLAPSGNRHGGESGVKQFRTKQPAADVPVYGDPDIPGVIAKSLSFIIHNRFGPQSLPAGFGIELSLEAVLLRLPVSA